MKNGIILGEGSLSELKTLIPGQEVLVLQTIQEQKAIALAQKYCFIPRRYGNDLAFLLPEPLDLKEVMTRFEGILIDSISRQRVRL